MFLGRTEILYTILYAMRWLQVSITEDRLPSRKIYIVRRWTTAVDRVTESHRRRCRDQLCRGRARKCRTPSRDNGNLYRIFSLQSKRGCTKYVYFFCSNRYIHKFCTVRTYAQPAPRIVRRCNIRFQYNTYFIHIVRISWRYNHFDSSWDIENRQFLYFNFWF